MIVQTRDKGAAGIHEGEIVVKDWLGKKRGEGKLKIEVRKPKV